MSNRTKKRFGSVFSLEMRLISRICGSGNQKIPNSAARINGAACQQAAGF
jgi:hypothetical protein